MRLWHLMALVLASSILFATAHALGDARIPPTLSSALRLLGALVAFANIMGSLVLGLRVGARVAGALTDWGCRRAGWREPVAAAGAIASEFLAGLLGAAIGFALAIGSFVLTARMLGR